MFFTWFFTWFKASNMWIMWRFDLRDWDFHQTGRFTVTFMGKPMGLCIPISGDDFKTLFSVSNGFSFPKETEMVTQEKTCCHLQTDGQVNLILI